MPSWRYRNRATDELTIAGADGDVIARIPAATRVQMQYLCTRLELHEGGVPYSIGVTSAVAGEGVTFVTQALAAVLNRDNGHRTCLVGTNWWGDEDVQSTGPGLVGLLEGTSTVDEVLVHTRYPGLAIIDPGTVSTSQGSRLSRTELMRGVLDSLRSQFDHVVLDLPAIATSPSALSFGAAADGALLVTRQRLARVDEVEAAVADLRHTHLLGVVLNDNHVYMPGFVERRLLDT